jgi:hypothetical protein
MTLYWRVKYTKLEEIYAEVEEIKTQAKFKKEIYCSSMNNVFPNKFLKCAKHNKEYVDMIKSYASKGKRLNKNEKERIMEVISKAYKGNSRRYDDAIRTIKKE